MQSRAQANLAYSGESSQANIVVVAIAPSGINNDVNVINILLLLCLYIERISTRNIVKISLPFHSTE